MPNFVFRGDGKVSWSKIPIISGLLSGCHKQHILTRQHGNRLISLMMGSIKQQTPNQLFKLLHYTTNIHKYLECPFSLTSFYVSRSLAMMVLPSTFFIK